MVLGSHQDFILSLCNKSDIADSFHMLDGTLTQYFNVDQQCFGKTFRALDKREYLMIIRDNFC